MLDSVLEAGGADPEAVERVTIGFDSVAALAAGRVDAATAFWNAEGVVLRRLGVPTREFRVDDFGAPRYPELILTTTAETLAERPGAGRRRRRRDRRAATTPWSPTRRRGLDDLVAAVPELDRDEQRAQLDALLDAGALGPGLELDRATLDAWARWEAEAGIVDAAAGRRATLSRSTLGASTRRRQAAQARACCAGRCS